MVSKPHARQQAAIDVLSATICSQSRVAKRHHGSDCRTYLDAFQAL